MKILQVIQFFTPARGGSVAVPYTLSKELAKKGHDVTIITSDFEFDKEYAGSIEKYGVNVIPFKCTINIASLMYSPKMKEWLKENLNDFDIIHMHNYRTYQNNIVYYYAKKMNIPYILQAHGSLMEFVQKKELKKVYDFFLGHKLLKNAEKLIAVSGIESKQYQKIGLDEQKIVVIPNSLDLNRLRNLPEKGSFKTKLGLKEDDKFILFLGRLNRTKGIDFLIKSFQELTKELNNVLLVIVGPKDNYGNDIIKTIESLDIKEKIKVLDHLNNVSEAYQDAEVLVAPSKYEIFGLVPFEAIICGTPVIVTKDSGCGELIMDIGCGYVVKYGNIDDLKNKMKYVIENPNKPKIKIIKGQNYIINHLCADKITELFEKTYISVINSINKV